MRYMLLIYKDEKLWDEMSVQEKGTIFQQAVEFSEDLRKRGVYLAGDPLHPTSTATTVRMKNGKTLTTDGPFAGGWVVLLGAPARPLDISKNLDILAPWRW